MPNSRSDSAGVNPAGDLRKVLYFIPGDLSGRVGEKSADGIVLRYLVREGLNFLTHGADLLIRKRMRQQKMV